MVSLLRLSFVSLLMLLVVLVQSETLVETSNDINESQSSPTSNQQLYELYKIMRTDPRLASVSNHDIVAYIYRTFVRGNDDQIDYIKPKNIKQRGHRHRKTNEIE